MQHNFTELSVHLSSIYSLSFINCLFVASIFTRAFLLPRATAISGGQVGSGPMCSVLVLDVFGLTTFVAMAENQILALVHTEAGVFIRVVTQKMSQYHALQLRLRLYRVRTSIEQIVNLFCMYMYEYLSVTFVLSIYLSS